MNTQDINFAWAVVVPILRKLDFHSVKDIAGLAGFDMIILNTLGYVEYFGPKEDRDELLTDIGNHFLRFADERKHQFLNIIIEELLSGNHLSRSETKDLEKILQYRLNRLGWQLIDKKVLPIELLDSTDLNELDTTTRVDLIKAATRFRDGDLSCAISSACAAVDSVTERVYREKTLAIQIKAYLFKNDVTNHLKKLAFLKQLSCNLEILIGKILMLPNLRIILNNHSIRQLI